MKYVIALIGWFFGTGVVAVLLAIISGGGMIGVVELGLCAVISAVITIVLLQRWNKKHPASPRATQEF